MMRGVQRHLDAWSWVIIVITFLMFVAAVFLNGLSHDLLLEGGVFLVSLKLILMAYKNSIAATKLHERLDGLEHILGRIEERFEARRLPELSEKPPNKALQPTGADDRGARG